MCMRRLRAKSELKASQSLTSAIKTTPFELLKKPIADTAGKSCADYGAHLLALNFPYGDIDTGGKIQGVRIGSGTIGLSYDGDWKTTANNGRVRCQSSEKHKSYLEAVKSSLEISCVVPRPVHPFLDTLRVNLLRGANTKWHCDAFKGVTNNYLLVDDDGHSGPDPGFLTLDMSISFRCSVVIYRGSYFIPVSYSESSKTLRMVGFGQKTVASRNLRDSGKSCKMSDDTATFCRKTCCKLVDQHATFYLFDSRVFHELTPYGNLPFAVIGIIEGRLQVIFLEKELHLFLKPLTFDTVKFSQCIALAKKSPSVMPKKKYKHLEAKGKWMEFTAWRYRHCWQGNNLLIRHHCYFRLVRQIAAGGNIVTKGNNVNFVECRVGEVGGDERQAYADDQYDEHDED
jgi:hypothetical protein